MSNYHLFTLLEGTWTGEGHGEYPTITPFDYRETMIFTRRDERSLAYEQRTEKRFDGQDEWLVSHWENGFIRILDSGEAELVNAQSGGRAEVLVGNIEELGEVIQIDLVSKTILNDPRTVSSARRFKLDGDTLRYEMEMQTTKVEQLTQHLEITLQRVK
jgi:hypothetical protein